MIDWSLYPNFSEAEFRCRHCGKVDMQPEFLAKLQELRRVYGRPMNISSGYRCLEHPVEKVKPGPGMHTVGMAADVAVAGTDAFEIIRLGLQLGFTGLGVQQKGTGRFVHLDIRKTPMVWSY